MYTSIFGATVVGGLVMGAYTDIFCATLVGGLIRGVHGYIWCNTSGWVGQGHTRAYLVEQKWVDGQGRTQVYFVLQYKWVGLPGTYTGIFSAPVVFGLVRGVDGCIRCTEDGRLGNIFVLKIHDLKY